MSAEIIHAPHRFKSSAQEEESAGPYLEGKCRCLHCKHEWVGVAPLGTVSVDCPSCGLRRGAFIANVLKDGDHWTCRCGSILFACNVANWYCIACGTNQRF